MGSSQSKVVSRPYGPLQRIARRYVYRPDRAERFLADCRGVIHVGANTGQERKLYDIYSLDVLWIEPIPTVFETLQAYIANYPKQKAVQALITDRDGQEITLHIANNAGASSSIFELGEHKDVWPDVAYSGNITCLSKTLATLMAGPGIDPARYDALVMDTQGSELLVLTGAEPLLSRFKFIKTEAADFEMYQGGVKLSELESYLAARGFTLIRKDEFARREQGGACYNVLFKRV